MKKTFFSRNWIWLAVILGPLLLFAPSMLTGKVLYWGTPSLQFVPWQSYAWDSFQHGLLPLWNPLNGMGAPLAANYQLGYFYPPNWILYLFEAVGGAPWIAWGFSLLTIIHLAWAGVGMILLMRQLGIGEPGQVVSGITFGLCGFLVGRFGFFSMIWAASWLPWVIWSVGKIGGPFRMQRKSPWISVPAVICLAMQLLAGHAQLTWYTLVLAVVWVGVGGGMQGRWRGAFGALVKLGVAIFLAFLVAAIQLLPTAEYLLQSQRADAVSYETAMTYSFWPWRLVTILLPDFFGNPGFGTYWGYASYWEDALYIGVVPLGLALSTLGFLSRKRANPRVNPCRSLIVFSWICMLPCLMFAMGKFTPIFSLFYEHIPTFAMFNSPTRWMLLVEFLLIILAGVGMDSWGALTAKSRRKWRLFLAATIAITLGAFAAMVVVRQISITFIQAVAVLGGMTLVACLLLLWRPREESGKKWRIWKFGILALILTDLLMFSSALVPVTSMNLYSDENTNTRLSQLLEKDQRIFINKEDEYLIKFTRFLRFRDFRPIEPMTALRSVDLPNINLLDDIPSVNNFDPLLPDRYVRWMDYLATLPEKELVRWLGMMNVRVWERRAIDISEGIRYAMIEAQGRYQWFESAVFVPDGESAWSWLREEMSKSGTDIPRRVVVEGQGQSWFTDEEPGSVVSEIVNQAGYVELQVTVGRRGVLALMDSWYPGWKVYVDGQPAALLRANYLFMGVELFGGTHRVVFAYQPDVYSAGIIISLLGWVILATSYIIQKRNNSLLSRKDDLTNA